jgi:shikimate dehydrogenase
MFMANATPDPVTDQVNFVSGKTRLYGIVGDPIEQVRSPEMITWELQRRGMDALLLPLHVRTQDFDEQLPALMRLHNLDGLVFTIPFKNRAFEWLATHCAGVKFGPQAQAVSAINALARRWHRDGSSRWEAEVFDGLGCVEGLRRHGVELRGRKVLVLGLGGAGSAIAAAAAHECPHLLRLHDLDAGRLARMMQVVRSISPDTQVESLPPHALEPVGTGLFPNAHALQGIEVLLQATPVGMLGDARLPLAVDASAAGVLAPGLTVFDAIVKPETTPLLALAQRQGCKTVPGRDMMRGQIGKMADFFQNPL